MNNETFRSLVKKLYPIACSTGRKRRGAVRRLTQLMNLRKHQRLCKCGCGEPIHKDYKEFASNACRLCRYPRMLKARLLASAALCFFSLFCVLSAPPMPSRSPLLRPVMASNVVEKTYSVFLAWDCSPSPEVTGYIVYHGPASKEGFLGPDREIYPAIYTNKVPVGLDACQQFLFTNTVHGTSVVDIGNADIGEILSTNIWTNTYVYVQGVCTTRLSRLPYNCTNFIAVTAHTADGTESEFSNEVFTSIRNTNFVVLTVTLETADMTQEDWTNRWTLMTNHVTTFIGTTNSQAFRSRLGVQQTNYLWGAE